MAGFDVPGMVAGPTHVTTVAHLITGLGVGGAERMLAKIVTNIRANDQRHFVISMLDGGAIAEEIRAANVTVYSLGMRRGIPSVSAFRKLVSILRQEQPGVLQTWLYHADLLGLLAGRWARIPRIAWNIRCSNTDMSKYRFTSTLVLRLLCLLSGKPDLILFNSVAGLEFHKSIGYRPRHSDVIPNGFDTTRFAPDPQARSDIRAELGIGDDTLLVGAVGRFDPAKDYPGFLQACTIIADRFPNVDFAIVGDNVTADHPDLAPLAQSDILRERLHLPGGRSDVERCMAAFDVSVSPSGFGEGFPNVIGEAMSSGVPIVVTDVGDSARIVADTGVVAPVKNPEALANAVCRVLERSELERKEMGAMARDRIKAQFSLPAIAAQYEDTYRSLDSDGHA